MHAGDNAPSSPRAANSEGKTDHFVGFAGSTAAAELRKRLAQAQAGTASQVSPPAEHPQSDVLIPGLEGGSDSTKDGAFVQRRQRKLSQSDAGPRRGNKLAMFEGGIDGVPHAASTGIQSSRPPLNASGSRTFAPPPILAHSNVGHSAAYRFSFYSNALSATIHARSISELPADGQSFEETCSIAQRPFEHRMKENSFGCFGHACFAPL